MRAQALLLAVPSMAMAVVGLAMFGPGAVQAFDGARIRGGPVSGPERLAWRITVLQRFRSIDSTRNIGALTVRARDLAPLASAQHLSPEAVARCETNQDGACEVALDFDAPVVGPVHAVVTADQGNVVLAQGEVQNPAGWGKSRGHPAKLEGSLRGDFSLEVCAKRGVFAAPFYDQLIVSAHDPQGSLSNAAVKLRSSGAEIAALTPTDNRCRATRAGDDPEVRHDASGESIAETAATLVSAHTDEVRAAFCVAPRTHVVEVDVEVTHKERKASWSGVLPVVPGAIWFAPSAERLHVVSPVPRDVAYATIANERGRYWGGAIPLKTDSSGFAVGVIDWPALSRRRDIIPEFPSYAVAPDDMWLTLSSDPLASGAGTVGWPYDYRGIGDERAFPDQLLFDGMPAAEKRDQDRRYRARTLASVALGAAAVLEGILLAHRARESGVRGIRAWAWTAMAVATVALAFAAIGVVVMWKTSG